MSLFRSMFQSGTYTPDPDTPGAASTYSDLVLALSPAAYWPMDEASGNLADASGNGFTATAAGGPTYRQAGPTIFGEATYAVALDGTGDLFTVDESLDDGVTTGDGMTLSLWFKTTSTFDRYLWTKDASGNKALELYYDGLGSIQFYAYQTDGATVHAYGTGAWAGLGTLDDGAWHHLVLWRDSGTGYWYMDVDGGTWSVENVAPAGTWQAESDSGVTMGGEDGGFNLFIGSLSNVAVWWSTLTAGERSSLYTGEA